MTPICYIRKSDGRSHSSKHPDARRLPLLCPKHIITPFLHKALITSHPTEGMENNWDLTDICPPQRQAVLRINYILNNEKILNCMYNQLSGYFISIPSKAIELGTESQILFFSFFELCIISDENCE